LSKEKCIGSDFFPILLFFKGLPFGKGKPDAFKVDYALIDNGIITPQDRRHLHIY